MATKHLGTPSVSGRDIATMQGVANYDRTFLPVANGTHFNGNGGAASTALIQTRCRQTRKLLRVIAGGADQLQIEWANKYTGNTPQAADATCEFNGPNNVIVRMSIEYPAGNMRIISASSAYAAGTAYAILDQVVSAGLKYVCIQAGTGQTPASSPAFWRLVRTYTVNWEGQVDTAGTVTFVPGDYKKSLPISLLEKMIPGDLIAVLGAFDSGAGTGTYIPYAGSGGASNTAPFTDWVVDTGTGMPAVGASIPEVGITTQTNGNTTTLNSTTQSGWMQIPYATAITGNIPTRNCVALFGDSLMLGTGGDIRDGEPAGIFVRSVDGTSYWKIAQGGNRAECYTPTNAPWQLSCAARCSAIVTDLGVGDIQANLTFAQTKTAMERLWKTLAATGVPVYANTFMPISNSTDAWATATNQTRWTNAGASATTQFPTDDATYLTSIYGLTAMWLTQDGASLAVNGTTVKVGQMYHPLDGFIDTRGLICDPATNWKWNWNGTASLYTADGAHPTAFACAVQAAYTTPQMESIIMARQQITQPYPQYSPQGEPPNQTMPRHQATGNSPSSGVAGGSFLSVVGVSPGRWYYGFRVGYGSGATGTPDWTLLAGMEPSKMKVVQSGVQAPAINSVGAIGLAGAPVWIPPGQLIAIVLEVPASTANFYIGANAIVAGMNKQGLGFLNAGLSTDTAQLTGTKSIMDGGAAPGVFAANVFRAWVEIY